MPTCVICLEVLKNPAALPCGHVFCYECLVQLVRNVQPYVHNHFCPTCRQSYTITEANPTLVPANLRLHITPSIRRLNLDYTLPKPKSKPEAFEPLTTECARLRAENASLKMCCDVWSKRARLHAGTTLGLIGLVRLSKDAAMKTHAEKDALEKKYKALKRSFDEVEQKTVHPCYCSSLRSTSHQRLSGFHSPILSPSSFCPPTPPSLSDESDVADCEECKRAIKRTRSEPPESYKTQEGKLEA